MAVLKINLFSFASSIYALSLALKIQNVWGKVGISYSPFVREVDQSYSNAYTRNDVKVMLKLVEEQGYHEIFNEEMHYLIIGAVDPEKGIWTDKEFEEEYVPNYTWKRMSSVVHTALAAAEINLEKNAPALTVYQRLNVPDFTEKITSTEIEVPFEVASMANNIYPGSVSGFIFPSSAETHELRNPKVFQVMEEVSARSRSQNLKFGARLRDCDNLAKYMDNSNIKRLLGMMDFLICLIFPQREDLRLGPDLFFNHVNSSIGKIQDVFNIESFSSISVYVETGWPGGENLGEPNSDVKSMIKFWNLIRNNVGTQRFIMHEAFNNPWREMARHIQAHHDPSGPVLSSYYGRWRHKQVKDDFSRNAYELKTDNPEKPAADGVSTKLRIGIICALALLVMIILQIITVVYRKKILSGRHPLS